MGTQRAVVIGEEMPEELGGPIAEHHGKDKSKQNAGKKKNVADKIKEAKYKKNEDKKDVEDVEDVKDVKDVKDIEDAKDVKDVKDEGGAKDGEEKKKVAEKQGKARVRSKKYKKALELIDPSKIYEISDAILIIKKTSLSKFDGNVELHIRLLGKNGKPENVRGTLKYPFATGKKITCVILDDKKIEEIEKTKKVDFDIALATPQQMPKVGKLAKILGPKGKMPNPKSGTVTDDPEKTKKELEGGLAEYKTDSHGIIHQVIGKVSAEDKNITENFKALIAVLPVDKITSANLCATMGPAVKVSVK